MKESKHTLRASVKITRENDTSILCTLPPIPMWYELRVLKARVMHLDYTELWATYCVAAAFRNPFESGSLWRGVFGRALRDSGCVFKKACTGDCAQPGGCSYSRLFEPPRPTVVPHPLLRGINHAPQPLVPLLPPIGGQSMAPGDTVRLGLRVLGGLAAQEFAALYDAQEGVTTFPIGRDQGRLVLQSRETPTRSSDLHSIASNQHALTPGPTREVQVTFETPAWLEQHDRLAQNLDFPSLFVNLYRRLTTLCALYGQLTAEDDARLRPLRELAAEVHTVEQRLTPLHWQRHSWESNRRHPMHGLVGSLRFAGPLTPFLPYLRLAELTHIGKATSFGLGRFRIEVL